MKTTMTLKVAATLAALSLPLTACTSGPTTDASGTFSRVADDTTTSSSDYLPDDRVIDSPVASPDYNGGLLVDPTNGETLTTEETGFALATCELLDEGYEIGDLLLANMAIDLPFTPGRTGELMAIAVYVECPQHTRQMESFLSGQGY